MGPSVTPARPTVPGMLTKAVLAAVACVALVCTSAEAQDLAVNQPADASRAAPLPRVDFAVTPNPAVRNTPTTFISTGRCRDAPCTYRWFHGDGSTNEEIEAGAAQPNTQASFTYTGPAGTRTITLRVRDQSGDEASRTKSFRLVEATVPPQPPPPPPAGWPNADNTGVPTGTTLTPSGGMTITTAGMVVNARDITGQLVVNAPNVTVRNSRIRSNSMWVIDNNSTGLVVEDSEIINRRVAGQNNCHNGIGNSNFTVRRTEITGCENAMNIGGAGNVTFTDNYVHDLDTTGPSYVWGYSPHTDGIQIGEGSRNLVIRHNWIDPSPGSGATAPIIMYTGAGTPNSDVWIEDNYLDGRGASYALYAPRRQTTNVNVNRNRMLKGYGYTACVRLGVTVATFNDNRDAITGALLSPDNGGDGGCSN
jgi:hypothetical protein